MIKIDCIYINWLVFFVNMICLGRGNFRLGFIFIRSIEKKLIMNK